MQVKPIHTLLFMLGVMAMLTGVIALFPKDGIAIPGGYTLYFPDISEFLPDDQEEEKDLSMIMNMTLDTVSDQMVDSVAIKKKLSRQAAVRDSLRRVVMKFQYKGGDHAILYEFFRKLEKLKSSGKRIRIMHYGDSQIEGDRISGYIRYHLQRKFGGSGPGLIPAMQPIPSIAVEQRASENWNRYTMFGLRDTTVFHNRFGMMASFSRFTPVLHDTMPIPAEVFEGWIAIDRSRSAYANCKEYSECRMYYSHNRTPVIVQLKINEVVIRTDTLRPSTTLQEIQWDFDKTPESFTLDFKGCDSPDIYGLSLDSKTGLAVDNIPLRGSAGTVFTKMNGPLLKALYDDLEPELFILQFGGNVMPYVETREGAEGYGRSFKNQIERIHKLRPGAAVIVIGPSDMSIKQKDKFVTYPHLEMVRDILKNAAFEAGAAYWDLFEVMGGKNSMPLWVEADPPLAAKDYTHFSPKGARKVAELFYSAFIADYEAYKNKEHP
ncbi:MAG: hypothetical protein KDD36_03175 [Flavobacteriales bacterium]|nr:hypothetical protein [Flavobacteriales bacterium]